MSTKALQLAVVSVFVLGTAAALTFLPRAAERAPAGSFDPLVRTVSAGSAGGLRPTIYITARHRQSIVLRPERGGDQAASVTVNARGTVNVPAGDPMPDVNGMRALWTGDRVILEWEPGAWAFIEVQGFPDDRERAVAVVSNLRFDERLPIEVPYTVQTSWQLESVRYAEGDVELEFTNNVRLALRAGTGFATGPLPEAELDVLERSVRPADPPVTNPFR